MEIVAFEALLRSSHRELDGPMPVLRAAERHGRLGDLARVVTELAAGWLDVLPPHVLLFVNVHPDELADPAGIAGRLERIRPWASRVVLEITERSKLQGIDRWDETVQRLVSMGFSLAVDDLGAGHSTLAVLAELRNPRFVKVDMSIIRGIDADPRKARMVDLLCRFCDGTGSMLVAEGVETEAELTTLMRCGAHLLQGYLLGRPSFELPAAMRKAQ